MQKVLKPPGCPVVYIDITNDDFLEATMRKLFVLGLMFLAACGDSSISPCQTAVDAQTSCLDQAGVSYDPKTFDKAQTACVALLIAKPGFGDWVSCQTQAFDQADCSSPQAAQDALSAAEACGNPLE